MLTVLSEGCYNPHMRTWKKIDMKANNSNNDDRNHRVVGMFVR